LPDSFLAAIPEDGVLGTPGWRRPVVWSWHGGTFSLMKSLIRVLITHTDNALCEIGAFFFYIYLFMSLFIWWYWSLNSGLGTCQVTAHPQTWNTLLMERDLLSFESKGGNPNKSRCEIDTLAKPAAGFKECFSFGCFFSLFFSFFLLPTSSSCPSFSSFSSFSSSFFYPLLNKYPRSDASPKSGIMLETNTGWQTRHSWSHLSCAYGAFHAERKTDAK
jgi:hypothetical protein